MIKNLKYVLLTVLIFSFYGSAFSQLTLKETIKFDTAFSKSKLFDKSEEWIALKFVSANDVIQLKNKDNGKIIIKGNLGDSYITQFTLMLSCKDSSVSYLLTGITSSQYGYLWDSDSNCYTKQCRTNYLNWKSATEITINNLILNYKDYLLTDL